MSTAMRHTRFSSGNAGGLRNMLLVSAALHGAAIVGLILWRTTPADRPPPFRVQLIGAPAGAKQMGVVAPPAAAPAAPTPEPAAPPKAAERVAPAEKAVAKKKAPPPVKATANNNRSTATAKKPGAKTAPAAPPTAGSEKGGKGSDVANINLNGIEFAYPGYLRNIVQLIKLNFAEPPPGSTLRTEVRFTIHRDGTVTDIEITKRSGSSTFDLNAMGAVEAGGARRAFGPLPTGFPDDVLIVYFVFSPETS